MQNETVENPSELVENTAAPVEGPTSAVEAAENVTGTAEAAAVSAWDMTGPAEGTPDASEAAAPQTDDAAQNGPTQRGPAAQDSFVQAAPRGRTASPSRPKRSGRAWGWLIGTTLLALTAACAVLLAGLTVRGGRGIRYGKEKSEQAGSFSILPSPKTEEQFELPEDVPQIEIHEKPRDEDGYTTQYIADQVSDSVVCVMAYDGTSVDYTSSASGIILSEDGYIITNAHVVVDSTRLSVETTDGEKMAAICIGYDERTDLAVIKINATGLHPAIFGDSNAAVVGERVIAIGNPGGFAGSVSQGILSGKNREIQIRLSNGTYTTMTVMQTDAAINPGNSGGPLLNAYGQVIGINSSKIVYEGFEGIGFAIPINDALPILESLMAYGYVHDRPLLGVTVIALDATSGPANGLPSQGLYIATIEPYSDLNNWGITAGDVILKANGIELIKNEDLSNELKNYKPGDTIELEILHVYDNTVKTVEALLKDAHAAEEAR